LREGQRPKQGKDREAGGRETNSSNLVVELLSEDCEAKGRANKKSQARETRTRETRRQDTSHEDRRRTDIRLIDVGIEKRNGGLVGLVLEGGAEIAKDENGISAGSFWDARNF
jgi:hypothetical protein